MRSSDINPRSISCPLGSQRLNVPVAVPNENHDAFINQHVDFDQQSGNSFMYILQKDTKHRSKIDPDRSICNSYQLITNTSGAVVAMVK